MNNVYNRTNGKKATVNTGLNRLTKRLKNLSVGDVISDKAFNPYANGVTRFSLAIWETIKKHVDITGFTKAEMTFNTKDHYILTLTHKVGYKFKFHGMGAGYFGEGSRGTQTILQECGFSYYTKCFTEENFTLCKKAYTMPLKKFTLLVLRGTAKWTKEIYCKNEKQAKRIAKLTSRKDNKTKYELSA